MDTEKKKPLSLQELSDLGYEADVKAGWFDPANPKPPEDSFVSYIALTHAELSEALEDFRAGKRVDEVWYEQDGKPCGIPSELADVMIRTIGVCRKANINIAEVIEEKIRYNMTRPYRHGGKKL